MERNCLRPSFRCQRVNTSSSANAAVKSQRNKLGTRAAEEEDFLNGISWPPRSYMCSFCKREFRSAQALGGHMNVHRRHRAMLRQYSPPAPPNTTHHPHVTNLNLNLHNSSPSSSPNPNLSSSSETSKWPATNNDNVVFGCPLGRGVSDLRTNSKEEIAKANVFERGHCCGDHWNKGEKIIGLDIEIGTNKDIDLELRLGYSA